MIRKIIMACFVSMLAQVLYCQNSSDSIVIKKGVFENKYILNNKVLSINQLQKILAENTDGMPYLKKAKSTLTVGYILAGAGGALIGFPIGSAIGGGKPNWLLAGIGAGLIIIDIPLIKSADKNLKKAVDIYNSGIKSSSKSSKSYNIHLGINQSGLAFVINF